MRLEFIATGSSPSQEQAIIRFAPAARCYIDCAIFLYHSSSVVVPLRLSQAGFGRADCLAALNATGNETLALYHLFDCTGLR